MLRASASAFGYDVDISALVDPSADAGIPGASQLIALVDAVLEDSEDQQNARSAVIETLDEASLVDAASVFGNFEMMNRVAEASGIPIAAAAIERSGATIADLGIAHFQKH